MSIKKLVSSLLLFSLILNLFTFNIFATSNDVVMVNGIKYSSFEGGLGAIENQQGGTLVLLDDIVLGKSYTINYDMTIEGNHTIYRSKESGYSGTLFKVSNGVVLTLDGVTFDGGCDWSLNRETYYNYLYSGHKSTKAEKEGLVSFAEGAIISTAPIFSVSGKLIANNCVFQNNFSKSGNQGLVSLVQNSNAHFELNNSIVEKCGSFGASAICQVTKTTKFSINDGSIIRDCHFGLNGGVSRCDNGIIEMNDGHILNNTACDANGYIFMTYGAGATLIMNGGKISNNSGCKGPANGFNSPLYMHSESMFKLNNGEICNNIGYSSGGVYIRSNSVLTEITGDNVKIFNNIAIDPKGVYNDIYAAEVQRIQIYAGQYTQDITEWLAPNRGVIYEEGTPDIYIVTTDIAELNGTIYSSVQEAVDTAKAGETVKLLCNSMLPGTVMVDNYDDLTIDMNNKKLYSNILIHTTSEGIKTEDIDIAIQVDGDLILKNGSIISHKSNGKCIEVNGRIRISNVNCKGLDVAIQGNSESDITISGGYFEVKETDDTPSICEGVLAGVGTFTVKGGTYKGYNPEEPDYVATNYVSELSGVDNSVELFTVRRSSSVVSEPGDYDVPVELTQESTIFSVTVPTCLPVSVDSKGVVTVANNNQIINNSFGPIEVKNVFIVSKNDWELVDFNSDFKNKKVGLREFGMKINNSLVSSEGVCSPDFGVINGLSSSDFSYAVNISPQSLGVSGIEIADVFFMIGWYK